MKPAALSVALALALLPALAHAADPAADGDTDPRHAKVQDLKAVEVTATPLPDTAESLTQPVEVLAGERLDEAKASSLGETVSRLPGVQSSYFGPGVGRPIVRGFDGARVQVLSDGLGSGDVSTVSADHAVSIEPFLADQVEVLKGPATLLYGSGAIGGAVNVVDGRVPDELPLDALQGRAELRHDSVSGGDTGMVRIDAGAGNVAFHFDGLHRETGDYDTPAGRLANSALRTDSGAFGLSWIGDRSFLGGGYSLYATQYGIPGEEDVRIDMDQRRSELRAGLDDVGPFETLRAKFARTRYTHTELEGAEVGTVFDNDGLEGRLELVHRPLAGFEGALGLQWSQRDFEAIGEEAFVPASKSRDAGLFWMGKRKLGALDLQLGARHDRNRIDVDEATAIGPDREFSTSSLSAALGWEATEAWHLSLGLDRAQRSPTAEELYSHGLHVATASYEQGAPELSPETANRAELGAHWHAGRLTAGASVYTVRYDDFIYLAQTGTLDDVPMRQWTQADARFHGAEAELEWQLAENASGRWDLRVFGDTVRATLRDGSHLPRIAPSRLGGELRWEQGPWRASLGAIRSAKQDDVAPLETPTPGYTMVDAHLAWHMDSDAGNALELFLDAGNLLDEEARPHTSFLKDVSPLPGRNIAFGIRMFF